MTYTAKPIIIKTKTNLHVGSEAINYDIVDKTVQRDTISNLPVINASSLKGALRYHFQKNDSIDLDFLLGCEEDSKKNKISTQGNMKFLDSYLLFLPLRSNTKAFYYTTSKENLLAFCSFFSELGIDTQELENLVDLLDENVVLNTNDSYVEDILCQKQEIDTTILNKYFGNIPIAILSDDNFIDIVKHLPIIARNKIKDGKSDNLWYEEVVPRESIFYTAMLDYTNFSNRREKKADNSFETFYKEIQNDFIQIGANASIGFGLCKFSALNTQE